MSCEPYITLKRGDDLYLELTVTDESTPAAIAAQEVLDAALAADPQIPGDISTATTLYNEAIVVDITGWTMTSQIRWYNQLIDTPTITVLDAVLGRFSLALSYTNTALWTANRNLSCDIEFTMPTYGVVSSETFIIKVKKDVTYV